MVPSLGSSSPPSQGGKRGGDFIETWLRPGSYLVLGRVLANGILYVTVATTVILQGKNIGRGVVGFHKGVLEVREREREREVLKRGGWVHYFIWLTPIPTLSRSPQ